MSYKDQSNVSHRHPPRVRMEYPVRTMSREIKVEIPFVIGVLADLSGGSGFDDGTLLDRTLLDIHRDNFQQCMKAVSPRVDFSVPNVMTGKDEIQIGITFESMDDFHPIEVVKKIPELRQRMDRLEDAPNESFSAQLNMILHHPDFRKLEGSWRGLFYLVQNTPISDKIRIRVLPVSRRELYHQARLYPGNQFDHSALFAHFWSRPFGELGADPFGCLIGDFSFDHSRSDLEILQLMMGIAERANAPFWAALSPALLHLDYWYELGVPNDTDLRSSEYDGWRHLRNDIRSRYIGLTMPRFLSRLPYGQGKQRQELNDFPFEEEIFDLTSENFIWSNPAFLLGVIASRAFHQNRWFARMRGMDSGGIVEDLPVFTFPSDDGLVRPACPVEIGISDRREAELSRMGIIPFINRKNSDFVAIISANSLHQPEPDDDNERYAQALMSARLPYLLNLCRIALYLKCITRDQGAVFQNRAELEQYLNEWLQAYVDPDPWHSALTQQAAQPMVAGSLEFTNEPAPGTPLEVRLHGTPSYLLEGSHAPMHLNVCLPCLDHFYPQHTRTVP